MFKFYVSGIAINITGYDFSSLLKFGDSSTVELDNELQGNHVLGPGGKFLAVEYPDYNVSYFRKDLDSLIHRLRELGVDIPLDYYPPYFRNVSYECDIPSDDYYFYLLNRPLLKREWEKFPKEGKYGKIYKYSYNGKGHVGFTLLDNVEDYRKIPEVLPLFMEHMETFR